jgi:type I restriction enzyme M protein
LFGDGVCARVKEQLLREFNLHTIVRLPNGVFAPYTSIPTNPLFFERSGPTKEIWSYEIPLPLGRKNYTKTMPMQFEEFSECVKWFHPIGKRRENDQAWKVRVDDVLKYDDKGALISCNLDQKNPIDTDLLDHLPPEQLLRSILEKESKIVEIIQQIQSELKR